MRSFTAHERVSQDDRTTHISLHETWVRRLLADPLFTRTKMAGGPPVKAFSDRLRMRGCPIRTRSGRDARTTSTETTHRQGTAFRRAASAAPLASRYPEASASGLIARAQRALPLCRRPERSPKDAATELPSSPPPPQNNRADAAASALHSSANSRP